jgi:protein-disulfide isomerase-like protein with CxxC motif
MASSFDVTWDYLCPFARNAHEHLVEALQEGADWDVHFRFFSLAQSHLSEDSPAVWDDPASHAGVLAGLAGIVVREKHADHFWDAHTALFRARHDQSLDLRDRQTVIGALDAIGLDGGAVVEEALSGWPAERGRTEHEEAVQRWEVFGVPTFIAGEKAVFVRLMSRPQGDAKLAESTIERVVDLVDAFPDLNEYKYTKIPR